MRLSLTLAMLCATLAGAAEEPDAGVGEHEKVVVRVVGNVVLPGALYLAALDRPDGPATAALANTVADEAEAFLHRAGYTLATVDGAVGADGAVVLTVNEGLLEKVVFRGRLTFQMLRLKLALDLPHEVFNKPLLEEQLARQAKDLGIDPPDFELIPTAQVKHVGPQLDTLGSLDTIQGATLLKPRQDYELHVFFHEREWTTGPGVDVRVSYFDGAELGVNYQGKDLLAEGDRWRVALMAGAGLRRAIASPTYYVFPSRVYTEALWYTPPFARIVRSYLWLQGEGLARQRSDLGLENYYSTQAQVSANIQLKPIEPLTLTVGFGGEHFSIFGQRAPEGSPPLDVPVQQRWRGFVRLAVDLVLDPGNGRWDRRHALEFEGRGWGNFNQLDRVSSGEMRLKYQKVFAFGWHDLVLKGNGTYIAGDVLFPFEEPLGEHLRGVFGDVWVRSALGARAEFRFSLTRDLYKLGVYVDGALWGQLDRATLVQTPRLGLVAGPSFHALIEGMFQMDLGVSFGLLSTGRFDVGLWAQLIKVF